MTNQELVWEAEQRRVKDPSYFFKDVKWSPDGLCLIVTDSEGLLSLYEPFKTDSPETSSLVFKEPEDIYNCTWYPAMNSSDPSSCVFASCSRDQPVHLWDAYSGALRASYRCFDKYDEVTSAISLHFSSQHLYTGSKDGLRIFHISIPGRDCDFISFDRIISSIDLSSNGVLALGTYGGDLSLFDPLSMQRVLTLQETPTGVSQLKFGGEQRPCCLFVSCRKSNEVQEWDLRSLIKPVQSSVYDRTAMTNQRIHFDIFDDTLAIGNTNATVSIHNLCDFSQSSFKANDDIVSGVSLFSGYLATCSGGRRFDVDDTSENNVRVWKLY